MKTKHINLYRYNNTTVCSPITIYSRSKNCLANIRLVVLAEVQKRSMLNSRDRLLKLDALLAKKA